MQQANFIVKPQVIIPHTAERSFIGPGMVRLTDGSVLMAAPWGRPPVNFSQLENRGSLPPLFRSDDGGRTWKNIGTPRMEWRLSGVISDGGITLLHLHDSRLAMLAHRHVSGLHGGGLPIISFSNDEGRSWAPPKTLDGDEGVWYVMNDRMIQTVTGRLIVPVSHMPKGAGNYEGDVNVSLCFYSDDAGSTWQKSKNFTAITADQRGMAEPCVVELTDGALMMLARTGRGCHYSSYSADGGETWSEPQPTTLTAACSPLTLHRLPDSRLIVFYNHAKPIAEGAFFPRTPLVYALSDDEGETWSEPVVIDASGPNRQHVYPSAAWTDEGMLMVYSTHYARPDGQFRASLETRTIGGGTCCLIAWPE